VFLSCEGHLQATATAQRFGENAVTLMPQATSLIQIVDNPQAMSLTYSSDAQSKMLLSSTVLLGTLAAAGVAHLCLSYFVLKIHYDAATMASHAHNVDDVQIETLASVGLVNWRSFTHPGWWFFFVVVVSVVPFLITNFMKFLVDGSNALSPSVSMLVFLVIDPILSALASLVVTKSLVDVIDKDGKKSSDNWRMVGRLFRLLVVPFTLIPPLLSLTMYFLETKCLDTTTGVVGMMCNMQYTTLVLVIRGLISLAYTLGYVRMDFTLPEAGVNDKSKLKWHTIIQVIVTVVLVGACVGGWAVWITITRPNQIADSATFANTVPVHWGVVLALCVVLLGLYALALWKLAGLYKSKLKPASITRSRRI